MSISNITPCPVCLGDGILLARMASLVWYRCRHCGMDFNRQRRRRPRLVSMASRALKERAP
jgi:ribosomal protein L37AE/L43A